MAKKCTFYYYAFAQIDLICTVDEISKKIRALEEDYYISFLHHSIDKKLNNMSRNEIIIWNEEYYKKIMEEYKIEKLNVHFDASQESLIFKNIVYEAKNHENDALRFLSGIGRTYFLYIYEQSYYLSEFKQYYNKLKNTVSISNRDPRLNSLFRPFYSLAEKIKKENVYNLKTFYGVSV